MSDTTPLHPRSGLRRPAQRLLGALVLAAATGGAAQAMTFAEYGHTLKEDASSAGHAIVRVGAQTGHGVVHAAKTVGGDVADGVRHGYHATSNALSHHDAAAKPAQPAKPAAATH